MSSAVCAISGVWLFDRIVPLFSKKFSRLGICSRSEGTLGLSRKKCTLSKVSWTTCWMPLPRWQLELSSTSLIRAALAALVAAGVAVSEVPARPRVLSMAAEPAAAVTRNHVDWRVAGRALLVGPLLMSLLPRQQTQRSPRRRPRVLTMTRLTQGSEDVLAIYLCKFGEILPRVSSGVPLSQVRAEIWWARAMSLAVRPPAEWVLRVSVTLFHSMVMSGW